MDNRVDSLNVYIDIPQHWQSLVIQNCKDQSKGKHWIDLVRWYLSHSPVLKKKSYKRENLY